MADIVRRLLREKFLVGDGCWEWKKASNGRYGISWDGQHRRGAHRHVYEVLVGPIPEGMQLDHLCKNTLCVRPDHLEPVTARENNRRSCSPSSINLQKTHCPQGHLFDEENTYHWRGQRHCKECGRARVRSYRQRQREMVLDG